jgi:hypothetical protein
MSEFPTPNWVSMDKSHLLLSELPRHNCESMDESHLLLFELPGPIGCSWMRVIGYCLNDSHPIVCPWMRVIDYCNRFLNSPTEDRGTRKEPPPHHTRLPGNSLDYKTKRCCI